MPEVIEKLKTNLKDRFNAITKVPTAAVDTLKLAKDEAMDMRPGKAATTILKKAGDGFLDMVDEQLDITRRWM